MLLRNLSRKQTYNDNIYGITRLNLIDSSISYLPFHALVVFWPDFLLKSASIDMVHSFSKIDTDSYISMTAIIKMLCKSKTLKISTNLRVAIMKRSHIVLQRVFQHENCTHPKKLHSYRFQKKNSELCYKIRNYIYPVPSLWQLHWYQICFAISDICAVSSGCRRVCAVGMTGCTHFYCVYSMYCVRTYSSTQGMRSTIFELEKVKEWVAKIP